MAKVRNIMQTDFLTLGKDARIEEASKLLALQGGGCVVVNEGNKPIGIVTELDILRKVISKDKSMKEPLSRIMTSPVTCMTPDMKLDEALKIIDTKRCRRYPVVDDNKLVGLITKRDIVISYSENLRMHRNIQNAVLILFVLFELFVFVFSSYFNSLVQLGV